MNGGQNKLCVLVFADLYQAFSVGRRRRALIKSTNIVVESRQAQILLNFDQLRAQPRVVFVRPRQRVPVRGSVVHIYAPIPRSFLGDQRRIDPRRRRQFIPQAARGVRTKLDTNANPK